MVHGGSQYIKTFQFNHSVPDTVALERHLLRLGLEREAFAIKPMQSDLAEVVFWERDHSQAADVLEQLHS
jgi:hypothetical protein